MSSIHMTIRHLIFKPEIRLILSLFLVTRLILSIIGVTSRALFDDRHVTGLIDWTWTHNPWLDIWGVWDTWWYLDIGRKWYSADLNWHGGANYAFFPLYPLLLILLGYVVGSNYIAGIIVSNVALIVAAYFLYRLVEYESNSGIARNSVVFLFLFPSAFIFSGVFTESLFLACTLISFYCAQRGRWLWVGIFGGLAAATRSVGILMALPLFLEYLRSKDFKIHNIGADILYLGFIPVGLSLYALQCYLVTGDFLAFAHIQFTGWGHEWSNPFTVLRNSLTTNNLLHNFQGIFTFAMLVILLVGAKRIGTTFFLTGMILLLLPIISGGDSLHGMLRFSLVAFPLYISLAKLFEDRPSGQLLGLGLALLQGFLMVFWTNGFHLIV